MYFDYPYYPFERPAELAGHKKVHPAVIIGAGPVGLATSLEFARHGIASVIIDPKSTVCDGSRAICISRRSMEILQKLGVAEAFLEKGLPWTSGRSFYRNQLVYSLEMPHSADDRYFPMTNLQQQYIEKLLIEQVRRQPNIELRWQSRLTGVTPGTDAVTLTIETPEGGYTTQAQYVIACDGARSAVRESLGLKLKGEAYEGRFLIADIKMASDRPTERLAFFDPTANPGTTVLIHKQADDIWRIDYQLLDDEDAENALEETNVCARIESILDMAGETTAWELQWRSLYKAYTLALDDYRAERIFFAGDAAHLVPIFGVRGLNSGFADANNLAWKLAYWLRGSASKSLLDSYSIERRAATIDIFREASKSTKFMTPPTRGYRLMRDAALSLSLTEQFPKDFVNPRQSVPYDYTDSKLTSFRARDAEFEAGPRAGAPLVNVKLPGPDDFLLDRLNGLGFTLLYFHDGERIDPRIEKLRQQQSKGALDITVSIVSTKELELRDFEIVADPERHVFAAYGAQHCSCYLVRPDGHVCARWRTLNPIEIIDAQRHALGEH